ncbi:zinc-binding dehydrogenase [Actinomycetospora endophytica]|uniref:Zinc-binding dehydrogenase n=1 Tax=Actinomycetospora endophytica TaxID=2291215 RepID=A0ABS8P1Q3_9PSEU|nr:zinc-binding dehydrogenase [Actinomycetospora endophytica]MCD2192192.1 zinc-binding dehydrogenase [Actinomycetospora endophytica]
MRAWTLERPGDGLRLSELDEPTVRPGGVLLEILAAHVPAYTDVVAAGPRGRVPTPLVLGAGGVGRVLAVADDVLGLAKGDVVAHTVLLSSGDVADPQEVLVGWTGIGGRGEVTPTVTAMQDRWRDGTFAERVVAPKETLVRLPGAEGVPPERLALLGWFAIAAEGLGRSGTTAGDAVAVLGATGQLGGAGVRLALAGCASRVVAVGRNEAVLDRLAALDPRVHPVPLTDRAGTAAGITAGGEVDVVLDALGAVSSPDPTLAGYDALRPGGTMVLIGGVRQDLALPYGDLMHRRLTLRGSWMFPPATLLRVWRTVLGGALDLGSVAVRTVGLDDPAGALELAAETGGEAFVVLAP